MTRRNRSTDASRRGSVELLDAMAATAKPEPRGEVVSGEVGFRLLRDPDTTVGIDVAYASAELVARTPEEAAFFDGPPVAGGRDPLAVGPAGRRIDEKVALYLEAGVPLVWMINARVTGRSPSTGPTPSRSWSMPSGELSAEPHLPGFRVPAAEVFG